MRSGPSRALGHGGRGDYNVDMRARLVRIGNSHGVRLPKAIIEQAGLEEELRLTVRGRSVVITSSGHPRDGWDAAFRKALLGGTDGDVPDEAWQTLPNEFDDKAWTW